MNSTLAKMPAFSFTKFHVLIVCILVTQVWPNSTTVWPDFTHPSVDQYWTSQISQFHSNVQFDGLWIDMNEPSNVVDGSIDNCPISSLEVPPFVPSMSCLATWTTGCASIDNVNSPRPACPHASHCFIILLRISKTI